MNLGVYAVGTGNHVSGWRIPGAATSGEDFSIFKTIADSCERGKLDFLFVGDSLASLHEGSSPNSRDTYSVNVSSPSVRR